MMAAELGYLAAWLMGLSGGLHCLAMCGGISAALGYGARAQPLLLALAYNLGRVLSYGLIGLLGGLLLSVVDSHSALAHSLLQLLSSLLLIAIGLHLCGLMRQLSILERGGALVWARLQPLALKLFPINRLDKALALGLLWGWLPCGLVYSALAWSASSGKPLHSAALMLCFGLGTLPWLLASTFAGLRLNALAHWRTLRWLLGAVLICLGAVGLYSQYRYVTAPPAAQETQHPHH